MGPSLRSFLVSLWLAFGVLQTRVVTENPARAGSGPARTVKSSDFANKALRGFNGPGDISVRSMSDMAATGANLARVFLELKQNGSTYTIDAASVRALEAV